MTSEQKKIGIFDSGIGGFSVWKELLTVLPGHQFYYISDRPHSPYGNKSTEYITARCEALTEELLKKSVDIILVACNTATAEAIDHLRDNFSLPFVGIEPFVKALEGFDISAQDVKPVVITTKAMNESERFKKFLKKHDEENRIFAHTCENLATLIEEGYKKGLHSVEKSIENELRPLFDKGYSHIILGCTHYPLVGEKVSSFLNAQCISPCLPVAKRVAHILQASPTDNRTELYFKTSDQENFDSFEPALLSLK